MNAFSLSRIQEDNTMKIKVAFVYVHNSCRSQIAEALVEKYGSDMVEVPVMLMLVKFSNSMEYKF